MNTSRLAATVLGCAALLAGAVASAAPISLQGTLALLPGDANATYAYSFSLPAPSTVVIQSYGFGGSVAAPGGTNLAGTVIPAGGFDTYLSLFAGSGASSTFVASNDDGACPPGSLSGGACRDPSLTRSLAAGTYTLVVSAFSNLSLAENLGTGTLGDGFTGLGNYDGSRTTAFAIDVRISPSFASAAAATFVQSAPGNYVVAATGSPTPTLSVSGTLPDGVTFTPASGALAGTPSQAGTFLVTFTAANGTLPNATQNFTLTVLTGAGDDDGDGIPNAVEIAEGRNPLVKDNDVFANSRLFAMQQYRDFLNREGDPAGIVGWTGLIDGGTYSRPQVIDAFLQSQEFSGFVAPVVRLYFATYLRVPDYAGLVFNAGLVRNGTVTLTQLADFFAASPEFSALYGALSDRQFVTLLYNNVLSRAPDQAGLDGWVALLNGGYTRGQVLLGFSESAEYQAAMANKVFVTMMYAGMLRRTPEPTGFNGWVNFLVAGTYTREQVINGFFLSTEYYNRFLP